MNLQLGEGWWVMDLGLSGREAIVCAASIGLGRSVAFAPALEGVNLVINARDDKVLRDTGDQIHSETGVRVLYIPGDITTAPVQNDALAARPHPDILINNAGGPRPGDFRTVTREDWLRAINANMLTPIELIRRVIDGMVRADSAAF